ncbi:cyanase [Malassezia yamatoensis]|uniref:Cyanate hydratase n=1 Tax=Malassezia yamatoensis TaxID=253288 RepID=A0AAJ6CIC8_9BASI|nr:cyanase [Malassezia yamatoensis]
MERDNSRLHKNLTTEEYLEHLRAAKNELKLSFADIAEKLGRDELYVAAFFFGQAKPDENDRVKLQEIFGTKANDISRYFGDDYYPSRGDLDPVPPKDPVLYRLYEAIMVYGRPIQSIIQEKFGDGIMSAIDFRGHVEKVEDPNGDRVKITFDGKFLPYRRW